VLGLGLMGGSLALAMRQKRIAWHITGYARRPAVRRGGAAVRLRGCGGAPRRPPPWKARSSLRYALPVERMLEAGRRARRALREVRS